MTPPESVRHVLITGASTGIGLACAARMAADGWHVFAGVRREADGQALVREIGANVTPVTLDVTDERQVAAAADVVRGAVGAAGLHGLVNNAGVVVAGPVEFVPLADWRRQFEVNVFGQVAVTQAVLPLLRAARGRIVNVSSISGRLVNPIVGPYAASKYALEAINDALRLELARHGVGVSAVEPGAIDTPIWGKSERAAATRSAADGAARAVYGPEVAAIERLTRQAAATAIPAERVADVVAHALGSPRPRVRYVVGRDARLGAVAKRLLPDRAFDWLLRRALGLSHDDKKRGA
ncbi:MAG TPA: SDR family oxidoreductase [Tepidisphaeraceae bacterium]|nr:SDR family oxidoreductase [Tepidisphaeraceae bacterium]